MGWQGFMARGTLLIAYDYMEMMVHELHACYIFPEDIR